MILTDIYTYIYIYICMYIYICINYKKSIDNESNNNNDINNNGDNTNGSWPILRVLLRYKEHFFLIVTLNNRFRIIILI